MRHTTRFLPPGAQRQLRAGLAAVGAVVALALATPACASPAKAAADREFSRAVQSYQAGRHSHAFGSFIALANRGDVDAARIALFMSRYGALLYGMHWEATDEDVEYWSSLVRNSSAAAGRPQPEFVPVLVKSRQAKPERAPARPATAGMGNR